MLFSGFISVQTDNCKDSHELPFQVIFMTLANQNNFIFCRPHFYALAWNRESEYQGMWFFSVQSKRPSKGTCFSLASIIIVYISDLTFQSLLNGLMCYKPDDPIEYLESCLQKVKELGGPEKVKWDTFVSPEKKTLPPLNGGQSRRSFFRNGNVLNFKIILFLQLYVVLHPLQNYFIHTTIADYALFPLSICKGVKNSVSLLFGICFSPAVMDARQERKL